MKLTILKKFDSLICHYLGLDCEVTRINRLHYVGPELVVTQTSGFKRHAMKSNWHDFADLEAANLECFGRPIGAALGKNVVISFKESVVRINPHA